MEDAVQTIPETALDDSLFDETQVIPPKKKRRWLRRAVVIAAALAVLGTGAYLAYRQWFMPEETAADIGPREYTISRGDIRISYEADGTVSLPYEYLDAEYSAELIALNIKRGDSFHKGDVLATLSDEPLLDAVTQKQEALDSALDGVKSAQNAVTDAETALASSARGLEKQKISYNDTISGAADGKASALRNIESQKQTIADAEWQLEDAKTKLSQMELFSDEYAATELAAQRKTISDLQNKLANEQNTLAELQTAANKTDTSPQTAAIALQDSQDSVKKANLSLSRARDALELAEKKAAKAEAELAEATAELSGAAITAPCDGTVIAINYSVGDVVSGGTPGNTSSLIVYRQAGALNKVTAGIPELDISQVFEGQTVEIGIDAWGDELLTGAVTYISSFASSGGNGVVSYAAEAEFASDDPGIRDQMNCTVTYITKDVPDVLYVPNDAVYNENGKSYVDVKLADGTVEKRVVKTGFSDGSKTEIQEGLAAGETALSKTLTKQSSSGGNANTNGGMMPGGGIAMPAGGSTTTFFVSGGPGPGR